MKNINFTHVAVKHDDFDNINKMSKALRIKKYDIIHNAIQNLMIQHRSELELYDRVVNSNGEW